ncbi:FG-GAP-like repeat-containing protein [Yinghuangia soli]|uniref:FG-GAP-like repeat-containing protein n=1 Tax=Yinghuangia soli TaxID=2908204 RepID=A0AA41Q582_9ACTN|nr:FG-GAP-like repeat-containing protein [Yinghuangia soli]MCF2530901.1 FG-GAP-like repeat-containing protein [Yinghuangia soli]
MDGLTTETKTVVANPDGTFTETRYAAPVRTKQDGRWVDLDATLVRGADGLLRPKASRTPVALSGGGTGPMAQLTSTEGKKLALTWPAALPQPVLDGDSATYPEVLPGVDLKVTANAMGGFAQVLVVKNARAAKNPKLAAIKMGMAADGLAVTEESDGSLTARSADGREVFRAPKATMWDSSTTAPATTAPAPKGTAKGESQAGADEPSTRTAVPEEVPAATGDSAPPAAELASDADGPGIRAKTAEVDAAPAADHILLTPKADFLDAPDTVYPVYIDPDWHSGWGGTFNWTWIQEGCANVGNYNDYANLNDKIRDMGVGRQRWATNCNGRERTFFEMDAGFPTDIIIQSATLSATQSYAADNTCANTHGVDLYRTTGISSATTWNNQPTLYRHFGLATTNSAGGAGCPNASTTAYWDITYALKDQGLRGRLTFGLRSATENESGSNGFKRFTRGAGGLQMPRITVVYNTPPYVPDNLTVNPVPKNPTRGDCGWIGATNEATGITLSARATDPDPGSLVAAQFHLYDTTAGTKHDFGWVPSALVGNGSQISVDAGQLVDGHSYDWYAQAGDGLTDSSYFRGSGGFARGCSFSVDRNPPSAPVVTSTDFPASGSGTPPTKFAGQKGDFSFTSSDGGGSGVKSFEYAVNGPLPTVGPATLTASADQANLSQVLIDAWGTNTIQVRAIDEAGNRSQPTTYRFYAPYDTSTKPVLGDITQDGKPDLVAADSAGNLQIYPHNSAPGQTVKASDRSSGPIDPSAPEDRSKDTWSGVLVTHRGGIGVPYDDLWAYRPMPAGSPSGSLYFYSNTLSGGGSTAYGGQYFTSAGALRSPVTREACRIVNPEAPWEEDPCPDYATNWSRVRQILSIGDVDPPSTGTTRNTYDLLTVETSDNGSRDNLWLLHGVGGGILNNPVLIDATLDWRGKTISTPGDATGDGYPDLWVRDAATGEVAQYKLVRNGDRFTLGERKVIANGLTQALYPVLSTDGDILQGTQPDLWATTATGQIVAAPGKTRADGSLGFDTPQVIVRSNTSWSTCKWFTGPGLAPQELCGPILAKYEALGGPNGVLRYPVTGVVATDNGYGYKIDFQGQGTFGTTANGSIYWSRDTPASMLHGAIRTKYRALDAEKGILGYPVTDETLKSAAHGGYINTFGTGSGAATAAITHLDSVGTHYLSGEMYRRYAELGGPDNVGYPSLDQSRTAPQPGLYVHLRWPGNSSDTASLYWSQTLGTSAKLIMGTIRSKWASLGWENGWLGFPVSDEYSVANGRRSDFQGGYTRWNRTNGVATPYRPGEEASAPRTNLAGDFNGDGRDDMATFTDYGDCAMGLSTSTTAADGTLGIPVERKTWPANWWCYGSAKYLSGDFNGDGRDDLAALYGYADGRVTFFTFLSRADGTFGDLPSRDVPPGNWTFGNVKPFAGDFNGDGRDDIGFMYVFSSCDVGLYTLLGRPDGGFANESSSYRSGAGIWCAVSSTLLPGDFNGDGRDDLGVVYDYGNGLTRLWTFTGKTDGGFNAPFVSWQGAPGDWYASSAKYTTGDFNADGRDDIGAAYVYSDNRVRFFTFYGKPDGGLTGFTGGWEVPAGSWAWSAIGFIAGKFDTDNRADMRYTYDYGDAHFLFAVVPSNSDGTFAHDTLGRMIQHGIW